MPFVNWRVSLWFPFKTNKCVLFRSNNCKNAWFLDLHLFFLSQSSKCKRLYNSSLSICHNGSIITFKHTLGHHIDVEYKQTTLRTFNPKNKKTHTQSLEKHGITNVTNSMLQNGILPTTWKCLKDLQKNLLQNTTLTNLFS